jgi:hypothetical protein
MESLAYHQSELEEIDLTSCWDLGDTAIIALLCKFRKYLCHATSIPAITVSYCYSQLEDDLPVQYLLHH